MAIVPVPSVSFESIRALSLGDVAREGRIMEAKVTAMLTDTLARLSIDGKPVDVITPKPLPIGATMTLKAEREGGQLRLVTQGPIRPAADGALSGPSATDMPDMLLDPLKTLLAKVQAMAVDVAPDARPAKETPAQPSAAAAFAALADKAAASQRASGQTILPQTPPAQTPAAPPGTAPEAGEQAAQSGQRASAQTPAPGQAAPSAQTSAPAQTQLPLPETRAPEPAVGPRPFNQSPATAQASEKPAQTLATQLPAGTSPQSQPDDAQLAPPRAAGADAAAPQAIAPRPQASASEAAPGQRATAEGLPTQPPAARAPAGGLDALQAVLAENAPVDSLLAQEDGVGLRPQPDARLHAAAPLAAPSGDADTPDPAALATRIAAAAQDGAPEARSAAASAAPPPDIAPPQAAASEGASASAQVRTERAALHFNFDIPLYFPGNPQPLRLEVTRDDGEDGEQTGEGKPRTWTIRFAAEAGPLGMIHAAITQTGEQIGVQLWAERGDTAALFKESARDLQDSLEASNIKLDALKIAEGRPEEQPARAAGEAFVPGAPREEIL